MASKLLPSPTEMCKSHLNKNLRINFLGSPFPLSNKVLPKYIDQHFHPGIPKHYVNTDQASRDVCDNHSPANQGVEIANDSSPDQAASRGKAGVGQLQLSTNRFRTCAAARVSKKARPRSCAAFVILVDAGDDKPSSTCPGPLCICAAGSTIGPQSRPSSLS